MSRLDSFIRRMSAQRAILNEIAAKLDEIPGPVLEFGYGSGRTYDHIRELMPRRRIVVFESAVHILPSIPARPADLVVGDIRETAKDWPDGSAAFIHADVETGDGRVDRELEAWLPDTVARLLKPGGYGVSGYALEDERLRPEPLPSGIEPGRYHAVRRL